MYKKVQNSTKYSNNTCWVQDSKPDLFQSSRFFSFIFRFHDRCCARFYLYFIFLSFCRVFIAAFGHFIALFTIPSLEKNLKICFCNLLNFCWLCKIDYEWCFHNRNWRISKNYYKFPSFPSSEELVRIGNNAAYAKGLFFFSRSCCFGKKSLGWKNRILFSKRRISLKKEIFFKETMRVYRVDPTQDVIVPRVPWRHAQWCLPPSVLLKFARMFYFGESNFTWRNH